MTKASDNVFPRFLISEGGSTSTPAAGRVTMYAKADGLIYSKDDAGTEILMSAVSLGSVATDTIWDAAGDLVQGTGANTAAKLTIGAAGTILGSTGSAAAWQGTWGDWTPALTASTTNPTLGSGSSVAGRYCQIGKLVEGWGRVTFGSSGTNAGSGQYLINYPVTPANASQIVFGTAIIYDASPATFHLGIVYTNSDTSSMRIAYQGTALIATHASPIAWTSNDAIYFEFKYEAA